MSAARTAFGVASFLPAVGVVATAAMFSAHPAVEEAIEKVDYHALAHLPTSQLITAAIVLLATVFVQIVLGAAAALLLASRAEITGTQKVAWPLACMFVGSIAAPWCYFAVVRKLR